MFVPFSDHVVYKSEFCSKFCTNFPEFDKIDLRRDGGYIDQNVVKSLKFFKDLKFIK